MSGPAASPPGKRPLPGGFEALRPASIAAVACVWRDGKCAAPIWARLPAALPAPLTPPAGECGMPRAAKPSPDMHFVRVRWMVVIHVHPGRAASWMRRSASRAALCLPPGHPNASLPKHSCVQEHVQQALPAALHARGLLQQSAALAADATYAGAGGSAVVALFCCLLLGPLSRLPQLPSHSLLTSSQHPNLNC